MTDSFEKAIEERAKEYSSHGAESIIGHPRIAETTKQDFTAGARAAVEVLGAGDIEELFQDFKADFPEGIFTPEDVRKAMKEAHALGSAEAEFYKCVMEVQNVANRAMEARITELTQLRTLEADINLSLKSVVQKFQAKLDEAVHELGSLKNGIIEYAQDTVWVGNCETAVDRIDDVLSRLTGESNNTGSGNKTEAL